MGASDPDEIAHEAVHAALARHDYRRAVLRGLVRWALIEFARMTDDESAADIAFARWRHHHERASRAPRFAGSRR